MGGFRPESFEYKIARNWLTQEVHPEGQLFGLVLRAPDPLAPTGRPRPFPDKITKFSNMHQNHDYSCSIDRQWSPEYNYKCHHDSQKWPKNVCPCME